MDKTCIVLWRQGVSLNTTFVCSIQLMLNNTFQTQNMKYGLINANLVTKWTITSSELVLHRNLWFTTERLNFRSITVWKIAQKTITANWKIRQTPAINSVLQRIVDPMVVCVCFFFLFSWFNAHFSRSVYTRFNPRRFSHKLLYRC